MMSLPPARRIVHAESPDVKSPSRLPPQRLVLSGIGTRLQRCARRLLRCRANEGILRVLHPRLCRVCHRGGASPLDANQFDRAVRDIESGVQRRRVLGSFFAASLAAPLFGFAASSSIDAKRRKNRKKLKRNSFGCVNVGQKCYGKSEACCSGICEGKGKQSKCAAHDQLGCDATSGTCDEDVKCGVQGVTEEGRCYTTTGNAAFCGQVNRCFCKTCTKDADCVASHGAGAACVQCFDDCTQVGVISGTACIPASQAQSV